MLNILLRSSGLSRGSSSFALTTTSQSITHPLLEAFSLIRGYSRKSSPVRGRHRNLDRTSRLNAHIRRVASIKNGSPRNDPFVACNVPSIFLEPTTQASSTRLSWENICQESYLNRLFTLRIRPSVHQQFQVAADSSVESKQHAATEHQQEQAIVITSRWFQPSQAPFSGARTSRDSSTTREEVGGRVDNDDDYSDNEDDEDLDEDDYEMMVEHDDSLSDDEDSVGDYESDSDSEIEEDDCDAYENACYMNERHIVYGYWTKVPFG